MNAEMNSLKLFIERVKSLSFFQRLFYWSTVRNSLVDAAADLSGLNNQLTHIQASNNQLQVQLATYTENQKNLLANNNYLQVELSALKEKLSATEKDYRTIKEECLRLKQEDEFRRGEHSNAMFTLQSIKEQIQEERRMEVEERNNAEITRIRKLKETWFNHQTSVRNAIKGICNKYTIEYMDQVPFRGDPDNTLKICEEYIVFDAKSPGSDDLTNFPSYIKDQAEKAKKYAKQEAVKSDIFFVVPSNTIEIIPQTSFCLGDFTIYIVSLDTLEPVILCLKKIEEYEFAGQLSPDERENICRLLGKFAHLTKRRIQIDHFFAKQFIEIAYKCENNLPADILEKVIEFEKSEKLNPPLEKRTKAINTKELEKDAIQLEMEAGSKGILIEDILLSNGLNQLPLYKPE